MKSTHPGCSEYGNITRRRFLIGAAQTAAIATAPAWLPKVAFARTFDSERDVLVSVYLRGGCDGLNLCVPHGDNAYYDARPTIAVPRPDANEEGRCTDLDGFFGFPPQMLPLLPAYQAGDLAIINTLPTATAGTRTASTPPGWLSCSAGLPTNWSCKWPNPSWTL